MTDLSTADVVALGRAAGLEIQEPLLSDVTHTLNALLEGMAEIDVPGLDQVEPLPILFDLDTGS